MPVNRNALVRYKTIDNCLRNKYRQWTLDDLIEACSEALYEYEGIDKGVSRRTVQMDIQVMRSEKLGYHAPIVVRERKYYAYENPEYSITNIPLTDQDLSKLTEVVDILKQFKGFTHFQELSGMVHKLENKIHVSKTKDRSIIDFEKNEHLKGLELVDPIFKAISGKQKLRLTYQSFKARKSDSFEYHPALLKEWRNRWFILGKKKPKQPFMMLALDRIEGLERLDTPAMSFEDYDLTNHFRDVIGATVNAGEKPQEIKLFVYGIHAPYIKTKPLHHSQEVIEKNKDGIVISLLVQHNFELEKEILSFGDGIKVLSPKRLRSKIKERLAHSLDQYHTDLDPNRLGNLSQRLENKGTQIINSVYTRKDLAKIGKILHHYKISHELNANKEVFAIRGLLKKIPELQEVLINKNIQNILSNIDDKMQLTKAIFFDKPIGSNWYVTWHQDTIINVTNKIASAKYSGWTKKEAYFGVRPPVEYLKDTVTIRIHLDYTDNDNGALHVLPGSHNTILSDTEIKVITENSFHSVCEVRSGGIHLMKPLLLHASSKTKNQKNRRVIHLEFCPMTLPEGTDWVEKASLV